MNCRLWKQMLNLFLLQDKQSLWQMLNRSNNFASEFIFDFRKSLGHLWNWILMKVWEAV